jgi:hypothetical protein
MKKVLLFLLLIVINNSYSQKFDGFKGFVVTNSFDTIKCKFESISNIFHKNIFVPGNVRNNVKIINEKGEKRKYKPFEIISFTITGTDRGDGDFKFISTRTDNYNHFYHEVCAGKISLFRIYNQDGYANETSRDIFIKDGEIKDIGLFSYRADMGVLISDFPELHIKWIDSNNYYKLNQYEKVIKLYNQNFKLKI